MLKIYIIEVDRLSAFGGTKDYSFEINQKPMKFGENFINLESKKSLNLKWWNHRFKTKGFTDISFDKLIEGESVAIIVSHPYWFLLYVMIFIGGFSVRP